MSGTKRRAFRDALFPRDEPRGVSPKTVKREGQPPRNCFVGPPSLDTWVWLKIKQEGQTAGVGPCFHLPGQPILEFRFFEPQPHDTADGCEIHVAPLKKPWGNYCLLVFTGASSQGGLDFVHAQYVTILLVVRGRLSGSGNLIGDLVSSGSDAQFSARLGPSSKQNSYLKGQDTLYVVSKPGYVSLRRRITMLSGLSPWLLTTY